MQSTTVQLSQRAGACGRGRGVVARSVRNVLRDREALRALFGVHEKIVAAEDGHGRTLYDCGVTNHYGNKVWLGVGKG